MSTRLSVALSFKAIPTFVLVRHSQDESSFKGSLRWVLHCDGRAWPSIKVAFDDG
jgi:hypothetical protein